MYHNIVVSQVLAIKKTKTNGCIQVALQQHMGIGKVVILKLDDIITEKTVLL